MKPARLCVIPSAIWAMWHLKPGFLGQLMNGRPKTSRYGAQRADDGLGAPSPAVEQQLLQRRQRRRHRTLI